MRCARCGFTWQADLPPKITAVLAAMTEPEKEINQSSLSLAQDPTAPSMSSDAIQRVLPPIPPGSNLPVIRPSLRRKVLRYTGIFLAAGLLFGGIAFVVWRVPTLNIPWAKWALVFDEADRSAQWIGDGFSLQQVRSERRFETGAMRLFVEGEVHNDNPETKPVPDIMVVAIGSNGSKIESWRIPAPVATLSAGADASFKFSTLSPESTVVEINLSFVDESQTE